jgi:hypothetical protein
MATLPAETFTPVLRGAGRCGSSVTAAIAEMVPRIRGCHPARGIPFIQDAGVEHAAMCGRVFDNGSAS